MIIGLDVGGTHTDVVLLGQGGVVREIKVPTDASDLFATVLTGLEKITADIDPASIDRAVLSTTLTTNAIVQKKFADVGMIVAGGPGVDPEFFRTNRHYFCVSGCIDHRGREIEPLDDGEIKRIAGQLEQEKISHVGVVGKFSVRNPAHELRINAMLAESFDKVFLGHRISGNLNFPRRIATTYLNAAIYPIHKAFFEAVRKSLEKKGLLLPIRILKADGGNMRFESSIDFPGQTILSGPAASVMGSLAFASRSAESLVMDIGGTTTDMAILIDGVPLLDPLGIELGGFKTLIRSLETVSLGLGGDSVVRLTAAGGIQVGPDRLGPAMAYGGPAPTPSDALFVMGKIDDGGDRHKSVQGLEPIAAGLGISVADAADKVFEHTCQAILSSAQEMIERINSKPVYTVHELMEGHRVKPRDLLVLGGPAQHFAEKFQALSNYAVRVIPRWQVANAIGAALARTTCEVTLFADTEREIAVAPEENFKKKVSRNFSKDEAIKLVFDLLRQKALERGANPEHLEMEVLESLQFNMVRGFYTTGRNIRVKAQVKPGLIHGYQAFATSMA